MIFKGKKIPFPAITQVSFFKVFESLKNQSNDPDPNVARFAKELLKECERFPDLWKGIGSEDFDKDHESIKRLCRVLFPEVLLTNEIKGIIPPFEFKPFYLSTRFQKILEASNEDFSFELNNYSEDQLYIYGCASILSLHYKYPYPLGLLSLVDIPNKQLGITRTYRLAMNGDMLEMIPTEKSIDITREDYLELLDNFDNIALWKKKFPPDSWIMRGIGITNLVDVTIDNALSTITSSLLSNATDNVDHILEGLRNLFGIKDLQVGFLLYENGNFHAPPKERMSNLILGGKEKLSCKENLCGHSFDTLIKLRKPLIVSDVDKFDNASDSYLSHAIRKQQIKSYIMAPIKTKKEFLGFLELGSPRTYDLNSSTIQKLDAVLPILSMAISRFKHEAQNRVEAIIQQECTTIHPAVKWRFEEEAKKFIARKSNLEQPVFRDIIFKQVYPLYGQLDIKGSSEKRNQAVLADLTKQLTLVKDVLTEALDKTHIPIYEELLFRVEEFRNELDTELQSGSEHRIVHFLEKEIHPVLQQLKTGGGAIGKKVDGYYKLLQPELQTIYEVRKKYDDSVNIINQALAAYIDNKQLEAQQMFPHYFERYKTDGVEYNMYVGQSISQKKNFDPVFLHNLQLWQLMVTCEMEHRFLILKNRLHSDIEIASLILVYSNPLSVHFRMDEKRFDVEGAYNARYEIVKKRIDKSHIKGTEERITSPGKIAIIYSNEQDAVAYSRYISFLEKKGYLQKNSIEYLEVEDLQGITGLKALRVAIDYSAVPSVENDMEVDALLESLQEH